MHIVRLPQFEGPLELLLSLIEKEKLDITRLSLAQVTDQYLDYLTRERDIPLPNLAAFLAVASRLILIKSRALLPLLRFDDEEEEAVEDLEWQLHEYRKFKQTAVRLGAFWASARGSFSRLRGSELPFFHPPAELTASDLALVYGGVLGEIPVLERLEEAIVEEAVTLEEKIEYLRAALRTAVETTFNKVVATAENRMDVVVAFLAMLELVKQRAVEAEQSDLFLEIHIRDASAVRS